MWGGEFVSGILDKWVSGLTLGEVGVGLSTFFLFCLKF
jgi:hypothetical protein